MFDMPFFGGEVGLVKFSFTSNKNLVLYKKKFLLIKRFNTYLFILDAAFY